MLWKIKRPCEHCPFRRDVRPFLRGSFARQLASLLARDMNWFACHETTGATTGQRITAARQSHCMGAAIVLYRDGQMNLPTRLALYMNMITMDDLDRPAPVFNTLEEFAAHHQKGE